MTGCALAFLQELAPNVNMSAEWMNVLGNSAYHRGLYRNVYGIGRDRVERFEKFCLLKEARRLGNYPNMLISVALQYPRTLHCEKENCNTTIMTTYVTTQHKPVVLRPA